MLSAGSRLGLRVQGVVSQAFVLLTYYSIEAWMRCRRYRILDRAPGPRRVRGAGRGPARAAAGLRQPPDAHRLADHPVGAGAGLAAVRAAGLVLLEPAGQVQHVDQPVRAGCSATSASACWCGARGRPRRSRRALDQVAYLLGRGQSVLIFPEGGRSRVGRVDTENFMYGVGRMMQESPGPAWCASSRAASGSGCTATTRRRASVRRPDEAGRADDDVQGHAGGSRSGHPDRAPPAGHGAGVL